MNLIRCAGANRVQLLALPTIAGLMFALCLNALPARSATPTGFADLVERLMPAVVNISTTSDLGAGQDEEGAPQIPLPPDHPLRRFLDEYFGDPPTEQTNWLGSGFVIDPEGHVVTNHHVIDGAANIQVNLQDNRSLPAVVVGSDPKTDIALLRVEAESPLPAVSFGDSDAARVGDWVVAIGSPFGFTGSVSAGIISARNRDIRGNPYNDFIQTDAAINRGNSGGPLFNLEGEVIGVNTAIISPSGVNSGIAFAVPAATASEVVGQLLRYGEIRRGWLGVKIQAVNQELAESLGLAAAAGALVVEVNPDSPAEAGGLRVGDVILAFDGRVVKEMRDLPRLVGSTDVGRTVDVSVWRDGETHEMLQVTVGLLDEGAGFAGREGEKEEVGEFPNLGLSLSALTNEIRESYGLEDDAEGILVVDVDPAGPAARQGVRPGDLILEVSQKEVSSPSQVSELVEEARAKGRTSVLIRFETERGTTQFAGIPIDEDRED